MGDKYQNKSITSAATSYLFSHVKSESLLVFSIAVAYQNLEIARLALGQIPLAQRSLHKVPIEYLRRFTIQAIQSFCRIKEGESESGHVSMYGRRSWDDLVLEFTVRAFLVGTFALNVASSHPLLALRCDPTVLS